MLFANRNTPHESTGEKPFYLLFGTELRSPTEASYLPPSKREWTVSEDYREEVVVSLSSARSLAVESIQKAQKSYKHYYDRKAKQQDLRIGDLVLVRFPQEEQGRLRKLSRPWHGPFRVTSRDDPDVTVTKSYFPQETPIQVHQSIVCPCPLDFPVGCYWYGGSQRSDGLPQWVETLLEDAANGTAPTDPESTLLVEQLASSVVNPKLPGEQLDDVQPPVVNGALPSMEMQPDSPTLGKEAYRESLRPARSPQSRYNLRRDIVSLDRLLLVTLGTSCF